MTYERKTSAPKPRAAMAHRRTSRIVMAELRQTLANWPFEQRAWPQVIEYARGLGVNAEVAWKIAKSLGAPKKHDRRAHRMISREALLEVAEGIWAGSLCAAQVCRERGWSESNLSQRLSDLKKQRAEEAKIARELERERARAKPPRPPMYSSEFIRPVAKEELCKGRASPRPTLGAFTLPPQPSSS